MRDGIEINGKKENITPHPGSCQSSFASGMASPNNDNIVFF
jgi:hypothetical protein